MKYNKKLNNAKKSKMDEFFTEYQTIEKELINYIPFFEGKTVYCNCDDYRTSAFFKFFVHNFKNYKLKKLICTWFDNTNGGICEYYNDEIHIDKLNFNGDFRDKKFKTTLDDADIVVTNPPFSLFRDFIKLMIENNKCFIVLGNLNAVKYKILFPFIKNNEIFLGKSIRCGGTEFVVPFEHFDEYKTKNYKIDNISGNKLVKVPSIRWFTNIKYEGYNKTNFTPQKKYVSNEYEIFDNDNNVINCNRVSDIPYDYDGKIGVPISFMDKYDSSKFEIIDILHCPKLKGFNKYDRIIVKKR